jgi:hypothetical protein
MLSTNGKQEVKNVVMKCNNNELHFIEGIFGIGTVLKARIPFRSAGYTTNYLYFGVKEKIVKGDWYINEETNELIYSEYDYDRYYEGFLKIVVSTDPELGLPRPSKEFMKKYCNEGGIERVLLQYVGVSSIDGKINRFELFVEKDNTVGIYPIRKEYKTSETVKLLSKILYDSVNSSYVGMNLKEKAEFLSDWLDYNLHNL